jgi:diguanylate cyclase (GGDEF)-like protein
MRLSLTTLQAKVLAVLLVGLLVSFGSLIALQSRAEYEHVLKVAEEGNRNQTSLIAAQSRVGIEKRDEALLENIFFDLVYNQHFDRAHSEIAKLRVLTAAGEQLKSFETLEAPETPDDLLSNVARRAIDAGSIQEQRFEGLTLIAAPVHADLEDKVIGAVVIAWDTKHIIAEIWNDLMGHAGVGGLAALMTIAALVLAMQRMVVRPLARLSGYVAAIRKTGELVPAGKKLVFNRNDEIGALSSSFNMMLEELRQAREQLIAQSESEINKRKVHLDAALNNMSQGLLMFDGDESLVLSNRRFADLYDVPQETLSPGTSFLDLLTASKTMGNHPEHTVREVYEQQQPLIREGRPGSFHQTLKSGQIIAVSHAPMDNGGWVATYEDITERKRAESQIEHMAHHDALTGLPNRVRIREELGRALVQARQGGKLAVLCLDLDHFKAVNDTLGHPVGDALLQVVAERLQGCLREGDTVARLGGDEFAVVQNRIDTPEAPSILAERIIEALSAPYDLDGHQVVVGASVGIALAPGDSDGSDELLKAADMALYRAKMDGRGTYRFFESEMDARMQRRRALELDLRKALPAGEFEIHYQPLVDLKAGKVTGFEALLRWKHPERGDVSPDDFIPLAEEIGLIGQIGAWVLRQACADASGWPGDVRVAVNLSPSQFKTRAVVLDVVAALGRSGLAAQRLELEITETVMLQDTEATIAILQEFRALGVRISMDDFGTGYSSLSYLRKFPFDKIKIDQSFVRDLPDSHDATAIIKAVSGLSTALGMTTTAEGVETLGQLDKVRLEGCTEVQGYYFSPAVPASQIVELISALDSRNGSLNLQSLAS